MHKKIAKALDKKFGRTLNKIGGKIVETHGNINQTINKLTGATKRENLEFQKRLNAMERESEALRKRWAAEKKIWMAARPKPKPKSSSKRTTSPASKVRTAKK